MSKVLNGVAAFLCCVKPTRKWHCCSIKELSVDSFGLRLYVSGCDILVGFPRQQLVRVRWMVERVENLDS